MKNKILAVLLFSICNVAFSQNEKEVKKIIKDYDVNLIRQKAIEFNELEKKEKEIAYAYALSKNIPISYTDKNGNFFELMKLTSDNYPLYYSTENQAAARSTRAIHLNTGGTLGLTLNGQGMVARIWDGGKVRTQHNHFGGRVTCVDDPNGTTYNFHATHVTGTILANGSTSIRGMAYQATGRSFYWDNDEAEAINETLDGMLISNHSYGIPVTSNGTTLPSWFIGTYGEDARTWDEIAYNAPYYLMVSAAGNSGLDTNNPEPIGWGYDKLTGNKTAKNNLVVANAEDATIDANGTLTDPIIINSTSSQGPTDDRRIKPDITGNGTELLSSHSTSNTATTTLSGTSMAAPNVSGTLLLLQQHYNNITSNFMKAATLKGLACHTADDSGNPGPDAIFGWGLLNGKAAAQTITNRGITSIISEETLTQNQTYTFNTTALGNTPLIASITWTDVPGDANTGQRPANDLTRALVNDLDIRISKDGTTYYPWKLDSEPSLEATRNSDNNIDNVEIIKIDAPTAGSYTVTINHKGNLVDNKQDYSLIITGINATLSSTDNELAQVKIFPNPTTGIVNIDLGALMLDNTSVIKLYDIQGRIISTKEMNSAIETVNLSHLSNGVYMLSIENGNAKTTKKIVLNR